MIKDVLLPLSTFPDATDEAVFDPIVRFVARLGGTLTGLALEVDIRAPISPLANLVLDLRGMIAAAEVRSREQGNQLLARLKAACDAEAVRFEPCATHCAPSLTPDEVTDPARLHDLTIAPLEAQSAEKRRVAEVVIFSSGRPVLLVPENASEITYEKVLVGWDYGRSSSRAVCDAMPVMAKVKSVDVVTLVDEKVIEGRCSDDVRAHFARHGITINYQELTTDGRSVGDVLQDYAIAQSAGFLVMGAYGHSRMRNFVLGGATQCVLKDPRLPIFLSH
jgi:nucleotide-binding universal stress UspA family protein